MVPGGGRESLSSASEVRGTAGRRKGAVKQRIGKAESRMALDQY